MAKFIMEIPKEVIEDMGTLYRDAPQIFSAMTQAGAEVVAKHIRQNARYAFADPTEILNHLRVTKPYRTYGGRFVNTKIAFYGYYKKGNQPYVNRSKATAGHEYRTGYKGNTVMMSSGRKRNEYIQEGVPVPLIVMAREFGTSSGEAKKPFVRKAFECKNEISMAMYEAQFIYSGGLLV